MNYAFFSLWLALGFSGWIIACAGLSALQRYENHSGISVLGTLLAYSSCPHPTSETSRKVVQRILIQGCLDVFPLPTDPGAQMERLWTNSGATFQPRQLRT